MNVVITGGAGFLGQRLARKLLARGRLSTAEGRQEPIELEIAAVGQPIGEIGDDARLQRILAHDSAQYSRSVC